MPPASAPKPFNPARLLADLNLAAKIWFVLFLLMALCLAATLALLLRPESLRGRGAIFVTANGRGYSGSVAEMAALTNVHVRAAEDITLALLSRNPSDFDQPERIPLLFQPDAARQARIDCDQESADRRARQLHQKPEITRLQYLDASNQRILFSVQGQLVQAGAFNGQSFVNATAFQLDLELVPNPNLMLQPAFPLVVQRFRHETHPR